MTGTTGIRRSRRFRRRHRRALIKAENFLVAHLHQAFRDVTGECDESATIASEHEDVEAMAAEFLAVHEPATAPADLIFVYAAVVHGHAPATSDTDSYRWLNYAYPALQQLRGQHHNDTLEAASYLIGACERLGYHQQIAALHQDIVEGHQWYGRTVPADQQRLDLAVALHNLGKCQQAHELLDQVWDRWRRTQRPGRRGACRAYRQQLLILGVSIAGHRIALYTKCGLLTSRLWAQISAGHYLPAGFQPQQPLAMFFSLGMALQWDPPDHATVCGYRDLPLEVSPRPQP